MFFVVSQVLGLRCCITRRVRPSDANVGSDRDEQLGRAATLGLPDTVPSTLSRRDNGPGDASCVLGAELRLRHPGDVTQSSRLMVFGLAES